MASLLFVHHFCSVAVCLDHAGLFVINMSSHDSGDGVYASHCVCVHVSI